MITTITSVLVIVVTLTVIVILAAIAAVFSLVYAIQQATGLSLAEALQILRGSYVCFGGSSYDSDGAYVNHEQSVAQHVSVANKTSSSYNEHFALSLISICSMWSNRPCHRGDNDIFGNNTIYDQRLPRWIQSERHPVCFVKQLGSAVLVCWNSLRSLGVLLSAVLSNSTQIDVSEQQQGFYVRSGLWDYYNKFRDEVFARCFDSGAAVNSIIVCGHSLGGILSTFFAFDVLRQQQNQKTKVYLYTFGSPRCVSKNMADWMRPRLHSCAHVELDRDIFRMLPTVPCDHIGEQVVYKHNDLSWVENHNAEHYAKILSSANKGL